jgi:ethanolamine ammonia-lyase large subunit
MKPLRPLTEIPVPSPRADERYSTTLFEREYVFVGLKALLGAADFSKAGDRHAGLAAESETAREAARAILSDLTLRHLYDHPPTDKSGRIDEVMRVNYDIDVDVFETIADWALGALKDRLLAADGAEVKRIGRGLTGVMAAAVAKLCDVHELILVAAKVEGTTRARTVLGMPGTLSSRLQPNHPTDDLRGVSLLCYWGLALGSGDALIGLNPAGDTVDNVAAILTHLDRLRRRLRVPTQICVLAHVKTQLSCLDRGAPVEVLFQSLAGTESTNRTEFDFTVDVLDEGYRRMAERGALRVDPEIGERAEQFMYFETGQGSEFTYGKHEGLDMTTCEALCYGLARRYDPFMVNNVTGFIGPETHLDGLEMILGNLQDQFMGKLLGLPMGMAPCYTLHSHITLEGQQIATELLTAARARYFMDVALNTDRMLAYFDTSGHDDQTLREVHGLNPAPEFLEWCLEHEIFTRLPSGGRADGRITRGPKYGDPRQFCETQAEYDELLRSTPAAYGFQCAGPRPANGVTRAMRAGQSVGREAIRSELQLELLQTIMPFRVIETEARDKESHLNSPDLGARLADRSRSWLEAENRQVQILVSDGLSAEAVHHNAAELLPVLVDGLTAGGYSLGQPMAARYGRVKLAEPLAEALQCDLVVYLIGERPGGDATASRSLSAYLVYRRGNSRNGEGPDSPRPQFEYTVISNIYNEGLPPAEAASVLVEKVGEILHHHAAGNRLEQLLQR